LNEAEGGVPLVEAIRFWKRHHRPNGGTRTVSDLYQEFLKSKISANPRQRTIEDIRHRIGRFAKDFGDRGVHEITSWELEDWLDTMAAQGVTRSNYIQHFRGFFNYALGKTLIEHNPAASIQKPLKDEAMPTFMPVGDVRKVLRASEESHFKTAVTLAVAFFAGFRTAELDQLKWSDIDFEKRIIRVRPEVAKKRRSRGFRFRFDMPNFG